MTEGPPRGAHRSGIVREHPRRSHRHHRSGTARKAVTKVAKGRPGRKQGLVAQEGQEVVRADQVEVRVDPEVGRMWALMVDSKEVIPFCVRR